MYYLCRAFVFAKAKIWLSHDTAHLVRDRSGLVVYGQTLNRVPWFDPAWVHHFVSLSKTHQFPRVLVNT